MIKVTQYIQLTLLMLLLFVLFQVTSISISFYNDKEGGSNQYSIADQMNKISMGNDDILLITGDSNIVASNIEQELTDMKKSYITARSLLTCTDLDLKNIKIIILASEHMEGSYDIEIVQKCMKSGINVILATLPIGELTNDWTTFLGINELLNASNQDGIRIFTGFFFGGQQDYENLKVDAAEIKVASTCKTYIAGFSDVYKKSKYEKKNMQDILWRNIYEGSQIFVVNGSFFKNYNSTGLLSAIFSQMYEDYIYPIINAKVLIVNNAPYLSQENYAQMQKRYARNPKRFLEDLVMPDIVAMCLSSHYVPTFYAVSSFNEAAVKEEVLNTDILPMIQEDIGKIGGEIGISSYDMLNKKDEQKVLREIDLLHKDNTGNPYDSLNLSGYDKQGWSELVNAVREKNNIKSVVTEGTSFSYYNGNIMNIPVISKGFKYEETENYKLQSMATSLGVVSHEIDLSHIIFPKSREDDWSKAMINLSSMIDTYWKSCKEFDSMNVTSMTKRIANFLVMKPEIHIQNNSIDVQINGFNKEAYFILRTGKEITKITNGTCSKIEEGAYLIHANDAFLQIALKQ